MLTEDLMPAVNEIRDYADYYALAKDYYEGKVGELFTSPAVRRALKDAVAGFDVNLASRPVDAVLDRIQILAVAIPQQDADTRWLIDSIWTPNRMDRYSKIIHWAALTYGDSYLIVWPGDEDNTVELHYNSPVTTRLFYDQENPRRKSYAAKMWSTGHGKQSHVRVNLYYDDRIEKYTSKPGSNGKQLSDFEQFVVDGEQWPLDNPYGQVPVFHFRTDEPYGRPEHRGAFGPQNAITKLSATLMATVDYQGFPQRYALLQAGTADDLFAPDVDDETAAPVADSSAMKSSPGTIWRLPNTEKVGQFDPANVDAFLKPISAYIRMMAAATATPLRFFDPQGQIPSGEALRADEAPLASRIRDREDYFAETWSECLRFAAFVLGTNVPAIDVQWRPVETVSDEQGWKTVLLKIQAGVPVEQALTETGYLSSLVEGWLAQAQSQSVVPTREASVAERMP